MNGDIEITVVDDEIGDCDSQHHRAFVRAHSGRGFRFHFCTAQLDGQYSAQAVAVDLERRGSLPDILLLDLQFGSSDEQIGLDILRTLRQKFPGLPVLVFSSMARDVSTLGVCLEEGAIGFVEKNASSSRLLDVVVQAIKVSQSNVLIGNSPPIRALRRQAARLSPYDQIPVLIVGERGTGKERVARHIHYNGLRSQKPLIAVNCASLAPNLIESELFGADQGAYTGATRERIGLIERADGGTLFLDEVGEIPLELQTKLLRVLQDGTYRRVGESNVELTSNFQLICATNANIDQLVIEGRLREDFLDRIAAVTIRTPPLRECAGDIAELAEHCLKNLGLSGRKTLTPEVLATFARFNWPGNVRQLQRVIQESVVRSEDSRTIEQEHLPESILAPGQSVQNEPQGGANLAAIELGHDPNKWPKERLAAEIRMIIAAKANIQGYKGNQWKAELMRLMYPHCKAANAKGFADVIKRLTQGPWGDPDWKSDSILRELLQQILET